MTDVAIRVEGLSKQYRIGRRERYATLRDRLADAVTAPFCRLKVTDGQSVVSSPVVSGHSSRGHDEWIWALKDVSFDVKQGEVVGIIGRNGAGKSTLLKILCRITAPTSGRAVVSGRVGSLLEVGTGFHPELTGRENIYLNGAILGMRKAEIERRFDEIVAFAEVEKFLDTPVRHYSSGMYVRLAFAVAAHLEPEILLVDEVLAVGDAAFQKKCLGKMGDVAKGGRTLVFVSHNMAAVNGLCGRGVVLELGTVAFNGSTLAAINRYTSTLASITSSVPLADRVDRQGDGCLRFTNVSFCVPSRGITDTALTGDALILSLEYDSDSSRPLRHVSLSIPFNNPLGDSIFMCWTRMTGQDFESPPSRGRFKVEIPKLPLRAGRYHINLWCEVNGILADWIRDAAIIDVIEGDFFDTGMTPPPGHGIIVVEHRFSYESS